MKLILLVNRAVAAAEIADIPQFFPIVFRHTSGDDIDIIGKRQIPHLIDDLLRIICQVTDSFRSIHIVKLRQKRGIEKLGEKAEVRFVVGNGIHEEFHLLHQIIHVVEATHFPLHQAKADDGLFVAYQLFVLFVVNVDPFEQGGIGARVPILRQILGDDLPNVKFIGQLEGEDGVKYFLVLHEVDVFSRGHLIGIFAIPGDSSSRNNGPQIQVFT